MRSLVFVKLICTFVILVLVLFTHAETAQAESPLIPKKLAVYYGFPSLVNVLDRPPMMSPDDWATEVFNNYDLVVFGEGLQDSSHSDHMNTEVIINKLKTPPNNTAVYGYIPIGVTKLSEGQTSLSISEIKKRVDDWGLMDVAGIFLDQAGYDFGVSRQRQNDIVEYVHSKGLEAFINAWNPDDVFSPTPDPIYNPTGLATVLGSSDIYLSESFQIKESEYQDPVVWMNKADKVLAYKQEFGVRVATVTTVSEDKPNFDQTKFDYAAWSSLLYGFEAMGWGELFFSAGDNKLPYHPRPNPGDIGDQFITSITYTPPLKTRKTNKVTIIVDTAAHTGQAIPCLVVTKQANPSSVKPGSILTYTLRVTNTSYITLSTLITDTLPSVVTPTGSLTWTPTLTGPGSNWVETVTVTVLSDHIGPLTNMLEVTTQEGPMGRAFATVCSGHCVFLPVILKQ